MMLTCRVVLCLALLSTICLASDGVKDTVKPSKVNQETILVESWLEKKFLCNRLKSLLHKVDKSLLRLEAKESLNSTSDTSRNFIRLTMRELNVTRKMVFRSIGSLYRLIHNNVTDVDALKQSSRDRLAGLRSETLREEKAYTNIKELDATMDKAAAANESRQAKGLVNGIIKEVASSADKLQRDLSDHVFEKALNDPKLSKAANVEAVIRLNEDGKAVSGKSGKDDSSAAKAKNSDTSGLKLSTKTGGGSNNSEVETKNDEANEEEEVNKVVKLVDAHDNLFVLSKGKDSTVPLEDRTLILDLVYLVISAAVLGLCCQVLVLPPMFGHILAGILLGPSGFSILKSIVQIETVGQFGVFLILFCVGMEFSPDKVRPVLRVSIVTSLLPALLLVAVCIGAGRWIFHASGTESAFVGACLSLSSTPLVVNFISSERHSEASAPATAHGTADYSLLLLGILVMQDVYLGILMALLPSLATTISSTATPVHHDASKTHWGYALIVFKLLLALSAVLIVTAALLRFVAGPVIRGSFRLGRGAALLVTLGTAFAYLLVTHWTNLSMELGCFLAGVVFSGLGRSTRVELEGLVEPVRDFLSAIFFASIGLHVFPQFMLWELTLLSACTALVVIVKFLSCLLLLRLCLGANDRARRFICLISAGLAQVSEFSFVLGSIARRLGLCSREVYLLVLGVTTLSLLVAPFLWKLMLCHTASDEPSLKRLKSIFKGDASVFPCIQLQKMRCLFCRKVRRFLCCFRCGAQTNSGPGNTETDGDADSGQALLKTSRSGCYLRNDEA